MLWELEKSQPGVPTAQKSKVWKFPLGDRSSKSELKSWGILGIVFCLNNVVEGAVQSPIATLEHNHVEMSDDNQRGVSYTENYALSSSF